MTTENMISKNILILSIFLGIGLMLYPFASHQIISSQTNCPANTTPEARQATLVGEIPDDGGDANLETWFRYGKTTSYGLESRRASKYGTGVFCAVVYNLDPCATYNYKAAAKNSAGTAYGENQTFTTKCLPMTVNLKVNNSDGPITVSYRNNVALSWTSENAASCQSSGDWSGAKAVASSQTIQINQVKVHTFTLVCRDSTGAKTATDSVTVNVTPNPPMVITKPAVVTR